MKEAKRGISYESYAQLHQINSGTILLWSTPKRIRRHSNANGKTNKKFLNEARKFVSMSKLIRKNWAQCDIQSVRSFTNMTAIIFFFFSHLINAFCNSIQLIAWTNMCPCVSVTYRINLSNSLVTLKEKCVNALYDTRHDERCYKMNLPRISCNRHWENGYCFVFNKNDKTTTITAVKDIQLNLEICFRKAFCVCVRMYVSVARCSASFRISILWIILQNNHHQRGVWYNVTLNQSLVDLQICISVHCHQWYKLKQIVSEINVLSLILIWWT